MPDFKAIDLNPTSQYWVY